MQPRFLAQITNIAHPLNRFGNYNNLVGDILGRVLLYAIPIAGIYFLVRLITAGFNMMNSLGDPGKIQAAQTELMHALYGLLIVLTGFFMAQIAEVVFGLNIL